MAGLTEDSWILLSASAFNLLQYVVLVEVYVANLASNRWVVAKGTSWTLSGPLEVLQACAENSDVGYSFEKFTTEINKLGGNSRKDKVVGKESSSFVFKNKENLGHLGVSVG